MSEPDLKVLLRSQDLRLVAHQCRTQHSASRDERLLWEDPSGPLKIYSVESNGARFYCLRLGDEFAVDVIPGNRITVLPRPSVPQVTVDHFLADQVLPRALSQKADLVLHAGAIQDGLAALLFLGPSGSGKSTLVASFQASSWTLMGDDAVILSREGGSPTARSLYRSLRLFPDSIEALFSDDVVVRAMTHYSGKKRIGISLPVQDTDEQAQVKAVFVLADAGDEDITIRRLSVAEACVALIENSFALDPSDPRHARHRMEQASRFGDQIPAFEISYPRDYAQLPQIREAILSSIGDENLLRT